MANYTIELRQVVETTNIFDFNYDFYDFTKKGEFEQRFIRHFYFREIGCETVDRFKLYLRDKMETVFPYYNELFKSASIKYDVLDNYKLTETYERTVENTGKSSGISSTVGQLFDKQENDSTQNKTVDNTGNVESTGKDTTAETAHSETDSTGNSTTNKTGSTDTTNKKTSNGTTTEKFLDTPQGAIDISNSNYLTSLKQNTVTGTDNTTDEQTVSEKLTTNSSDESQTNSERSVETNTTANTDSTSKETTADNVKTNSSQETKTTNDNNTRSYVEGLQTENYTITRRGNIGVDTDSDAIEKHNRLQKTLKSIEKMFFEECEDLFMLVY